MRRERAWLLALLAAAPALAAPHGRPGEIELSDGRVVRGRVRFTRDAVLRLHVAGERRTHRIDPADLAALEMVVASEAMERPYTFKNPGDPTKTYGEGLYPLRNLTCRLVRRDGRALAGALISTLVYVTPAGSDDEERFKLVRQQRGAVGESLDDLVYVRAVRWDAGTEAFEPATIGGRIETPHDLEEVVAYHRETKRIHRGRVTDTAGKVFLVTGLPAGTFDLFVRTTHAFLHPLPELPPSLSARDALVKGDLAAVQEATGLAADFFEVRRVVALAGTRREARALVWKHRSGKTSYEEALAGARPWRLEVWLWHALETEWRLDRRLYLFRGSRKENDVARRVVRAPELGGLQVEKGQTVTVEPHGEGTR
ncbi:MAG: hypothetical protein ACYTEZ_02480 [Planctomycetota bacterium]